MSGEAHADRPGLTLAMGDKLAPATRRLDDTVRALSLAGSAGQRFERVAGPMLKREVEIAAKAAFGTDLRPWNGKGVKAGYGYDLDQRSTGVVLVIKLRPAGVWAFGEHGARPHLIGIRRTGGRNRKIKRAYLMFAGGRHPVLGPVAHPGTKGRGAIRYVFRRVRRAQTAAVRAGITAALEVVARGR